MEDKITLKMILQFWNWDWVYLLKKIFTPGGMIITLIFVGLWIGAYLTSGIPQIVEQVKYGTYTPTPTFTPTPRFSPTPTPTKTPAPPIAYEVWGNLQDETVIKNIIDIQKDPACQSSIDVIIIRNGDMDKYIIPCKPILEVPKDP